MKPNILVLIIDSLRADVVRDIGVPTPNLKALETQGTSFTQCVASATTTTPSIASILTGCYPPRHGVRGLRGYRLTPSVSTMPEIFNAAGYETYANVTGPLVQETGVLRGFHSVEHRPKDPHGFMRWREPFLGQLSKLARPWLALLHIWEVHHPYAAPPDFRRRRDRRGYEAVVSATDEGLGVLFEHLDEDTIVVVTGDHGEQFPDAAWQRPLTDVVQRLRARFDLSRRLPRLDDKMASLTLGHGFAVYEHLVRVPLIVKGHGLPSRRVDVQTRHVDLLPTLADLCEMSVPDNIDGRSLMPIIEGRSLPEEPAYMEASGISLAGRNPLSAVRTSEWKLVNRADGKITLHAIEGSTAKSERLDVSKKHPEITKSLFTHLTRISESADTVGSGMTQEEEAVVEQHLRDLGYL